MSPKNCETLSINFSNICAQKCYLDSFAEIKGLKKVKLILDNFAELRSNINFIVKLLNQSIPELHLYFKIKDMRHLKEETKSKLLNAIQE
mmetsp:Transcript_8070/g.7143  ORF Transcript_8070/g.7143 Transcript_8070/m.7143 type:complete len:90 (+) Transcript_8070:590-859(+)